MAQSGSSQTEARLGGSALYGIYVLSLAVSMIGNLIFRTFQGTLSAEIRRLLNGWASYIKIVKILYQ
jgi:hypothetical protein